MTIAEKEKKEQGTNKQLDNAEAMSFGDTLKVLEKIDENKNEEIDADELKKSFEGGLFNNEGNLRKLTENLNKYAGEDGEKLEEMYKKIKSENKELWNRLSTMNKELENIMKEILKKEKNEGGSLTEQEIKIMQLWESMFGNILKTKLKNKRLSKKSGVMLGEYKNKANNIVDNIIDARSYYDEGDEKAIEDYLDLWGYQDKRRSEILNDWLCKRDIVLEIVGIGNEKIFGYERDVLNSEIGWENISAENITNLLNNIGEDVDKISPEVFVICNKFMGGHFIGFIKDEEINKKVEKKIEGGIAKRVEGYNDRLGKLSDENKEMLKKTIGIIDVNKENIYEFEEKMYDKIKEVDKGENISDEDEIFSAIYYKIILDEYGKGVEIKQREEIAEKIYNTYDHNMMGIRGLTRIELEEMKNEGGEYEKIYNLLGCGEKLGLEEKVGYITEGNNKKAEEGELKTSLEKITDKVWGKGEIENEDKTVMKLRYDILGESEITKIVDGDCSDDKIKKLYTLNKCGILKEKDEIKIENGIQGWIDGMSKKYNKEIAKSGGTNGFCGEKQDIKLIQLYASVNLGDKEIKITGKKSKNYNTSFKKISDRLTNEQMTDMYILRQEIKSRGEIIDFIEKTNDNKFSDILNIPNIDGLLGTLKDKETQNRIFLEFLQFYCQIKKDGLYFENMITGEALEKVLTDMVNREIYKDKPTATEISNWEYIKSIYKDDTESGMYQLSENMINTLKNYENLGDYYAEIVETNKKKLLGQHENNKENDIKQHYNEEIKPLLEDLFKFTEKGLSRDNKEYKNEYKKIADKFVSIWKQEKYKKYIPEIMSSDIFCNIYRLWKDDGIAEIFGKDVYEAVNAIANTLRSLTEEDNDKIENDIDMYPRIPDRNSDFSVLEKHYDELISYDYVRHARDHTATQYSPATTFDNGCISKTIHTDIYSMNGYKEEYKSVVSIEKISDRYGRDQANYHGYGTESYNPNATIVGPRKDGWYAILKDKFGEKANKGQINISIIMGNAYALEYNNNGTIKYWKYDKNQKDFVEEKTISKENFEKAILIESNRMKIWEADHGADFQKALNDFNKCIGKHQETMRYFKEWENCDLDQFEKKKLQSGAIQLCNMITDLYNSRAEIEKLRKTFDTLNKDSNGYENPYEKQINQYISCIDDILKLATYDNKTQSEEFMNFCLYKVDTNNSTRDKIKKRIPIVVGLIVGAFVTYISRGTLGPVVATLVGSLYNVMFREATQQIQNNVSGRNKVVVDGKEYVAHYTNPTLLEKALDPNDPTTFWDCVKGYGSEIIENALFELGFIYGGKVLSGVLSKMVTKFNLSGFSKRAVNFASKECGTMKTNDSYFTTGVQFFLDDNRPLAGKFTKFFFNMKQTTLKDSGEGWLFLAISAMVIKALMGQSKQVGVGYPKINIDEGLNKLVINSTYDGSNPDSVDKIKKYYENIKGYSVIQEGDVVKIKINGVDPENGITFDDKDIEMKFYPSNAPIQVRLLPEKILDLGGIEIDDKTGNITYESEETLDRLATYYRQMNLGIIKINADGTGEIVTKDSVLKLHKCNN